MTEFHSARAPDRFAPLFILQSDDRRVVAVPVENRVDSGRIRDDVDAPPGRAVFAHAQMRERDDIVGPFGARGVDGVLNGAIERFPGRVLHEVVDEVPVRVLKVARPDAAERLGSRDSDERDLYARKFADNVRLENALPVMPEVAADVREVGEFGEFEKLRNAEVEFMISGNRDGISGRVHERDDRLAARLASERLPLNGVPAVGE